MEVIRTRLVAPRAVGTWGGGNDKYLPGTLWGLGSFTETQFPQKQAIHHLL